jgi:hypothetical protein
VWLVIVLNDEPIPAVQPDRRPARRVQVRHVAAERSKVNMLNLSQEFLCGLALHARAAVAGPSATALDGDLVRLVPGGAPIVSGISDPGKSSTTGRLLVATENNNRDLNDCLALLGIDGEKAINEVKQS